MSFKIKQETNKRHTNPLKIKNNLEKDQYKLNCEYLNIFQNIIILIQYQHFSYGMLILYFNLNIFTKEMTKNVLKLDKLLLMC